MNILNNIIAKKIQEVASHKKEVPIATLEKTMFFTMPCRAFTSEVLNTNKQGIIAEIKFKSPSKGIINTANTVQEIAKGYEQAGASCLSVLTDVDYFGGSNANLILAHNACSLPIIRKDFIIDEYQVIEAKSIGADAILLIAANLSIGQCKQLARFAKSFGLYTLLELHDEAELNYINEYIDAVGVNNRNLKTFEVSLKAAEILAKQIPSNFARVAESGINNAEAVIELKNMGYNGFLIGEHFMKTENPGAACLNFVNNITTLQ
jgi:indole-3-glycerol phosphate synthase